LTVRLTVDDSVAEPAVPDSVSVDPPRAAAGDAVSVTIDTPAPFKVDGLKLSVTPAGRPPTASATAGPVVPVNAVCTVNVALVPWVTVSAVAPTAKAKAGLLGLPTTSVTTLLAVALPLTPATVIE
jgi:hypothetical protein